MLVSAPTVLNTAFWQFANQSHNASVNFCNRNATVETSDEQLMKSFGCSVAASIACVMGMQRVLARLKLPSFLAVFPAVAMANTANIFLMRQQEIKDGIEICDEGGNVLGTSKKAAMQAVQDTAITRVFLPSQILLVAPLMGKALTHLVKAPRLALPIEFLSVVTCFGYGLPLSMSLFKERGEMTAGDLEPETRAGLQGVKDTDTVYYNKGL
jgi:hypothetical protein